MPYKGWIAAEKKFDLMDMGGERTEWPAAEIGRVPAASVHILDVSWNKIAAVPREIGQLTALKELNLQFNQIKQLPAEIGRLTALKEVYLQNNQLTSLPAEIGNLTALEVLMLGSNKLTSLPAEIGQLLALRKLFVGQNQLKSLPAGIGRLPALKDLNVVGNEDITYLVPLDALRTGKVDAAVLDILRALPPTATVWPTPAPPKPEPKPRPLEEVELTGCPKFRQLNLAKEARTAWPAAEIDRVGPANIRLLFLDNNKLGPQLRAGVDQLAKLSKLRSLYLGNNGLTTFPGEVVQLAGTLELLDLQDNQLTTIPAEVAKLTALKTIYACCNHLSSISPEIGRLSALQKLNLHHNRLTSLPREIGQLTALDDLNVMSNQLSSIPAEIGHLKALKELYLSDNQLTSIPAEVAHLSEIYALDLSTNKLTTVPAGVARLPHLIEQRFSVYKNPLTDLPESVRKSGSVAVLTHLRSLAPPAPTVVTQAAEPLAKLHIDRTPAEAPKSAPPVPAPSAPAKAASSGPSAPRRDPREMRVADVCEWLRALDLGKLVPAFEESCIDGRILLTLTDADLKDPESLNIANPLVRRNVLLRISELAQPSGLTAA